jgi:hypothetical protein
MDDVARERVPKRTGVGAELAPHPGPTKVGPYEPRRGLSAWMM